MQNYYGFDGDDFVLIGAFERLGQALKASAGRGFFFVADEAHWRHLVKKMELLMGPVEAAA